MPVFPKPNQLADVAQAFVKRHLDELHVARSVEQLLEVFSTATDYTRVWMWSAYRRAQCWERFTEEENRPVRSWQFDLPHPVVQERRLLDAVEAWLLCPCGPHAVLVSQHHNVVDGPKPWKTGWPEDWLPYTRGWPFAVRADVVLPIVTGSQSDGTELPLGFKGRLERFSTDGLASLPSNQWLPGSETSLFYLPDMPPIVRRCQSCFVDVKTTTDAFPGSEGDSDCDDHPERNCVAGSTMTMEDICSRCGQDLLGGDTLCECFIACRTGARDDDE